jgi:hypothetical protein
MYATGDIVGRVFDSVLEDVYPKGVPLGRYPMTNAFLDDGTLCFALEGLPGLNPSYGSCSDRSAAIPPYSAINLDGSLHNDLAADPVYGGRYALGWEDDINDRAASTLVSLPYDAEARRFTGEPPVRLVGLQELFTYDGREDVYGNSLAIDDGYMCGTVRMDEDGISFGWCAPMTADGPDLQGNFSEVILFTRDDFVSSGLLPNDFTGDVVALPSTARWTDPMLGPHRLRTFMLDDDQRIAFFYSLGNRVHPAAVFVLRLHRSGEGWQSEHLCTATGNQMDYFFGDVIAPSMFGTSVQDERWAFGMLHHQNNQINVFDQNCRPLGWWRNSSAAGQWARTAPLAASAGTGSGLQDLTVHYDWPAIAALVPLQ